MNYKEPKPEKKVNKAKLERTPEQIQAAKDKMTKVRLAKKPKV